MIYAYAYSYALIVDWGFKRHIFGVFHVKLLMVSVL